MTDTNTMTAVTFLKLASSGKVSEAYAKYIGLGFTHHNPFFEGSAEALQAGMEENAKQSPNKVFTILRTISEGDFVVTHSHVQQSPEQRGAVVVHIFRFENGKIVELWDVGQPIPETSANQNGMF
ncbi:MAG TPA: nuclear transport factor 2 family protein [Anaerolineales bacterium]|nr:nuclear transport factor 2 family protein [Anaerolineales bacterium]HNE05827.1 nuclear transport factor 2 family protein [Anaerolineales bacterium]